MVPPMNRSASQSFLDPRRWQVLAVLAVAQFMVVLDATIVNVALPSIRADLGFDATSLQWVVNAYTLLFGGFLLLGGRARRPPRPPPRLPERPRPLRRRIAGRWSRDLAGPPHRVPAPRRASARRSCRPPRSRSS